MYLFIRHQKRYQDTHQDDVIKCDDVSNTDETEATKSNLIKSNDPESMPCFMLKNIMLLVAYHR